MIHNLQPVALVGSAASLLVVGVLRYGAILADAVIPHDTNWVEAAERLGILASVVLFAFLTGAGLLKWLLSRQAHKEDKQAKADQEREERVAKEDIEREQRLASRVTSLESWPSPTRR